MDGQARTSHRGATRLCGSFLESFGKSNELAVVRKVKAVVQSLDKVCGKCFENIAVGIGYEKQESGFYQSK